MIALYYHRGACSTSNHFALEDGGIEYETTEADLMKFDDPLVQEVRALKLMAQTPAFLDDGQAMTQNAANPPFIADLTPDKELLPQQVRLSVHRRRAGYRSPPPICIRLSSNMPRRVTRQRRRQNQYAAILGGLCRTASQNSRRSACLQCAHPRRPIFGDDYALIVLDWSEPAKLSLEAYPNMRGYKRAPPSGVSGRSRVRSSD